MRTITLTFAVLLAVTASSRAQPFEPLRSEGDLSRDFTRAASARYESSHARGKGEARGDSRRARRRDAQRRDEFARSTAITLTQAHRSGQILSGDWVSELVSRLGASVAAAAPATRDSVRFYVVASPAVNAFATGDHTVYVTMGLLARIGSEAELAFVLAHELGHVHHDHSLELHLDREHYAEEQASLRHRDRDDDPFAVNRYSRAKEAEADAFGREIYAELPYPGADAEAAFEVLRRSYLPFADHVLGADDVAAFGEAPPAEWILGELVEPDLGDDDDDAPEADQSTHPDIDERLAATTAELGDKGGEAFAVWTRADLARLRRQARYEVTDYRLRDLDVGVAIHNALWLLANDEQPDVRFLRRTLVQAGVNHLAFRQLLEAGRAEITRQLAATSKRYREHVQRRLDDYPDFPDADDAHGETQRILHLFAAPDFADVAGHWLALAVALEADYPDLASAPALTDRLAEALLAGEYATYASWAEAYPAAAAAAEAAELDLRRRFTAAAEFADLNAWNQADAARLARGAKRGVALGQRAATVVLPRYHYGNFHGGFELGDVNFDTEEGERSQLRLIRDALGATGLRGDVISDRLSHRGAEELNDVRVAREWLSQYVSMEAMRLIPHNHDRLLAVVDRENTDKLVFISEAETRYSFGTRSALLFYQIPYTLLSPFDGLAALVSGRSTDSQSHLVIDPRARRIELSQVVVQTGRQREARRRATYYRLFDQVAQAPRR